MSVDVPYRATATPAPSRTGTLRVRNQRYSRSAARRSRNSISNAPPATAAYRSATRGRSSGWMADWMASWVSAFSPVYSYHRRFRYSGVPSGRVTYTICGMASARVRNRAALSATARSCRTRSVTSWATTASPTATPSGSRAGYPLTSQTESGPVVSWTVRSRSGTPVSSAFWNAATSSGGKCGRASGMVLPRWSAGGRRLASAR